jgi:hypothetical protein
MFFLNVVLYQIYSKKGDEYLCPWTVKTFDRQMVETELKFITLICIQSNLLSPLLNSHLC